MYRILTHLERGLDNAEITKIENDYNTARSHRDLLRALFPGVGIEMQKYDADKDIWLWCLDKEDNRAIELLRKVCNYLANDNRHDGMELYNAVSNFLIDYDV